MRLEVGYGLEDLLPDARALRLLDDVVKPAFRRGDLAAGLLALVDAVEAALAGDEGPASAAKEKSFPPVDLIVLAVLLLVIHSVSRRGRRSRRSLPWFGGFSGGAGGSGFGGIGGGFTAGGGGFGGGGASGSW